MLTWLKSLFAAKAAERPAAEPAADSAAFQAGLEAMTEGDAFYLAKDFAAARRCYDKAIAGGLEQSYEPRAICLQALERDEEALPDFDRAIALSPQDCNLYFMRGISRSKLGDVAGTGADMRAAVELSRAKTERNRVYSEGSLKNGYGTLQSFYELQGEGFELVAKINERRRGL